MEVVIWLENKNSGEGIRSMNKPRMGCKIKNNSPLKQIPGGPRILKIGRSSSPDTSFHHREHSGRVPKQLLLEAHLCDCWLGGAHWGYLSGLPPSMVKLSNSEFLLFFCFGPASSVHLSDFISPRHQIWLPFLRYCFSYFGPADPKVPSIAIPVCSTRFPFRSLYAFGSCKLIFCDHITSFLSTLLLDLHLRLPTRDYFIYSAIMIYFIWSKITWWRYLNLRIRSKS